MSYPFPYALGICLATVACLAASLAAVGLSIQAASAWIARRREAAEARRLAEAAAWQAALDCLARLRALDAAEAEARKPRA